MSALALNVTSLRSPPDLLSFDSWDEPGQLTSSVCSASPSFDDCGSVNSLQEGEDVRTSSLLPKHPEDRSAVHVLVSGHHFSVDQDVFSQLQKLPWQKSSDGTPGLRASADMFEIVLNYLVFKTLPDTNSMSPGDKDGLELMALKLGLTELSSHARAKSSSIRIRRRTSSFTSVKCDTSASNKAQESGNPPGSPKTLIGKNVLRSSFRNRRRTSSTGHKSDTSTATTHSAEFDSPTRKITGEEENDAIFKPPAEEDFDVMVDEVSSGMESKNNGSRRMIMGRKWRKEEDSRAALSEGHLTNGESPRTDGGRKRFFSLPKRGSKTRSSSSFGGSQRQLMHEEWCASNPDIVD